MTIEDALGDDVLIAEHLDGRPLDGDHGAPVRLVSPSQYGFISTKHLCRIELHTAEPAERLPPVAGHPARAAVGQAPPAGEGLGGGAPSLPARLGAAARLPPLIAGIRRLSARGSERSGPTFASGAPPCLGMTASAPEGDAGTAHGPS